MIICCHNALTTLDTFHKVSTLFISILTFGFIIYGYMRYLENKVKDKQLEVIADFVKQIQQTDFIYIDFITQDNSKTKPIPIGIVTLFDIPEIEGFEEYNELCFWGVDDPFEKPLHAWDFFYKFYSNPFLPPTIAEPLKKFNFWQNQKTIKYAEVKKKQWAVLGRKTGYNEDTAYCFYLDGAEISTYGGFKQASKELRDSIINWLAKYGVKDLNITTSHIYQNKKASN